MRGATIWIIVGLAAGCGSAPTAAPELPRITSTASPTYAAVIDSARVLVREAGRAGVGIAVAVVRAGEPVWVEGAGWADRAAGEAVDPRRTRFRLYSVMKPMTAVAAARLMERGDLDPAASIRRYVPGVPEPLSPITPMQLAQHTSGIRHYADEAEARSTRHCDAVADALPLFVDDPLVHAPGAEETYSSWGYVLLSGVVEAVAGAPFPEAMERLVFEPAGMTRAAVDDPIATVPERSAFYEEEDGEIRRAPAVDNTCKWGAGGFVATAADVARFGAAMLDGTLLSPRSLQLFLRGSDTYSAQGVGVGGTAFLRIDAPAGLAVAVLANTAGVEAGPAAQRAFERIHALFGGDH